MDKYGRVLVIIFFLCLINLGLIFFVISKLNNEPEAKPTPIILTKISPSPSAIGKTIIPTDSTDIKADLTLIKAEIRALREILGTTKSFEELSNLIKNLNNNQP